MRDWDKNKIRPNIYADNETLVNNLKQWLIQETNFYNSFYKGRDDFRLLHLEINYRKLELQPELLEQYSYISKDDIDDYPKIRKKQLRINSILFLLITLPFYFYVPFVLYIVDKDLINFHNWESFGYCFFRELFIFYAILIIVLLTTNDLTYHFLTYKRNEHGILLAVVSLSIVYVLFLSFRSLDFEKTRDLFAFLILLFNLSMIIFWIKKTSSKVNKPTLLKNRKYLIIIGLIISMGLLTFSILKLFQIAM
jgi:hypothetical protein